VKDCSVIRHCAVSGDVVRHDDGRMGLVMSWQGVDDKREVCLAIRDVGGQTFSKRWYPMQYFLSHFTYVKKLEESG
jgi:hypothetical protein